jgi:hypothetical protein
MQGIIRHGGKKRYAFSLYVSELGSQLHNFRAVLRQSRNLEFGTIWPSTGSVLGPRHRHQDHEM